MKELEGIEKEFPELLTPDSPSQRVGGEPLKEFKTVIHNANVIAVYAVPFQHGKFGLVAVGAGFAISKYPGNFKTVTETGREQFFK